MCSRNVKGKNYFYSIFFLKRKRENYSILFSQGKGKNWKVSFPPSATLGNVEKMCNTKEESVNLIGWKEKVHFRNIEATCVYHGFSGWWSCGVKLKLGQK